MTDHDFRDEAARRLARDLHARRHGPKRMARPLALPVIEPEQLDRIIHKGGPEFDAAMRAVCEIPRDFRAGGNLSTHDLLRMRSYRQLRPHITLAKIGAILEQDASLIDDWLTWCANQRSADAWIFDGDAERGWRVALPGPEGGATVLQHSGPAIAVRRTPPLISRRYTDIASACADYILSDLDQADDGLRRLEERQKGRRAKRQP